MVADERFSLEFVVGELVTFNGYTGTVAGFTCSGFVRVSFGHNRRRDVPPSLLERFEPLRETCH